MLSLIRRVAFKSRLWASAIFIMSSSAADTLWSMARDLRDTGLTIVPAALAYDLGEELAAILLASISLSIISDRPALATFG